MCVCVCGCLCVCVCVCIICNVYRCESADVCCMLVPRTCLSTTTSSQITSRANSIFLHIFFLIYNFFFCCRCVPRTCKSTTKSSQICSSQSARTCTYARTRDEGYAAVCWRMLPYADVCCRMLKPERTNLHIREDKRRGVCWRMLTYADVCWRMLPYPVGVCWGSVRVGCSLAQRSLRPHAGKHSYADVCWCMLTYADVWWRVVRSPKEVYGLMQIRCLAFLVQKYKCEPHSTAY
jgi:hypothetical protein